MHVVIIIEAYTIKEAQHLMKLMNEHQAYDYKENFRKHHPLKRDYIHQWDLIFRF